MDGPEGIALSQNYSPFLTQMALGYVQQQGYIARKLFPNIPVAAPTGQYNILRRGAFLKAESKKLDNLEAAPIKTFAYDKSTFSVDKYGIATIWTDMDLANAGVAGIGGQNHINNKLLLVTMDPLTTLEKLTADLVRNTANWSVTLAGVNANAVKGTSFLQWNDPNSTPIEDIQYARQLFKLTTGFTLNTMVLPDAVWQALENHPEILSRIKYQAAQSPDAPSMVTPRTVGALFSIDQILVPDAVINTAKEGQPDAIQFIWGRDVWLGYVAAAPSREVPSAGYFFSWTGGEFAPQTLQGRPNAEGLFVRRYWENRPGAYFAETEWFTTPRVTAPDMGILMTNAIAATALIV